MSIQIYFVVFSIVHTFKIFLKYFCFEYIPLIIDFSGIRPNLLCWVLDSLCIYPVTNDQDVFSILILSNKRHLVLTLYLIYWYDHIIIF